jgi:hypothetical protein
VSKSDYEQKSERGQKARSVSFQWFHCTPTLSLLRSKSQTQNATRKRGNIMKIYEWNKVFDKMSDEELKRTKEALENLPTVIKAEFEGLTTILGMVVHEANYRNSGFKRGV